VHSDFDRGNARMMGEVLWQARDKVEELKTELA
jgi:hypothetical protein